MADITKRLDALELAINENRILLQQILAEIRSSHIAPVPPVPIHFPPPTGPLLPFPPGVHPIIKH